MSTFTTETEELGQGNSSGTVSDTEKNAIIRLLLWFFLGAFGGHRYYDGKIGSGIAMAALFFLGSATAIFLVGIPILLGVAIWWLIDGISVIQKLSHANQ